MAWPHQLRTMYCLSNLIALFSQSPRHQMTARVLSCPQQQAPATETLSRGGLGRVGHCIDLSQHAVQEVKRGGVFLAQVCHFRVAASVA